MVADELGRGDAEHGNEHFVKMAIVREAGFPGGIIDRAAGHDPVDSEADAGPQDIFIKRNACLLFEKGAQAACGKVHLPGQIVDSVIGGRGGREQAFNGNDAVIRLGDGGMAGQGAEQAADDG